MCLLGRGEGRRGQVEPQNTPSAARPDRKLRGTKGWNLSITVHGVTRRGSDTDAGDRPRKQRAR